MWGVRHTLRATALHCLPYSLSTVYYRYGRLSVVAISRLVDEVGEITDTVEALQQKLSESENALQQLLRTKSALEADLAVKNNSLFIDREKCLGMRKTFPMSHRMVYL